MEDVLYSNLVNRGYVETRFEADEVTATFRFVDTVTSTEYAVDESQTQTFTASRDDLLLR